MAKEEFRKLGFQDESQAHSSEEKSASQKDTMNTEKR